MAHIDYTVSLSLDTKTGDASAYIVRASEESQWEMLADTEFGPFDTATDIGRWVGRQLALAEARPLR